MNEKKVTIITLVVLGVILVAGGVAIWYLQFNILAEKEEELAKVQKELAEKKALVAQIPALQAEIARLQPEYDRLILQIPTLTREEYDKFADMLDQFRLKTRVTVSTGRWAVAQKPAQLLGRPPVKQQPPSVHKVQYDLSITGDFYQLLRYMNELEKETRFINVENFTITKASETGPSATGLLRDMKLTLYSYTYRPHDALEEVKKKLESQVERKGSSTDIPE